MKYEPEEAWKWRLRAEELRAHAEGTKDPTAKQTYRMLADSWDKKADATETAPWLRPVHKDSGGE